jgi:phosphoserine aminotransferase
MVPLNLYQNGIAEYILSGQWSKKAYEEASRFGKAYICASSADRNFSGVPDCSDLPIHADADYVYYCMNNTIFGTKFKEIPDAKGKPLVSDISSCFLSEPVDVSKFGILWGGVQKNIGPAGLAIAIVREDLIRSDLPHVPVMMKYSTYAESRSLYNTPPVYNIYICGKVFRWLLDMGGLEAIQAHNQKKAALLYDFLDSSALFRGTVVKKDRSLMNVPFVTDDEAVSAAFLKAATEAGFVNLKGHRSVGGMRASIYNAMPLEGVEKLVAFMERFEKSL